MLWVGILCSPQPPVSFGHLVKTKENKVVHHSTRNLMLISWMYNFIELFSSYRQKPLFLTPDREKCEKRWPYLKNRFQQVAERTGGQGRAYACPVTLFRVFFPHISPFSTFWEGFKLIEWFSCSNISPYLIIFGPKLFLIFELVILFYSALWLCLLLFGSPKQVPNKY